jgi:histidyl-tRNA synthetase
MENSQQKNSDTSGKEDNTMSQKEEKIPTRVLAGFMELLPAEQLIFDKMLETIKSVYELYGFTPIDTPAIERADVLLAKVGGETAKQIYRFSKGDNDLALRFDLTVPLARYVSEHTNELSFPFRRYHIAKVYRGESPQKGRYREFYQCDIDVIGNEKLNLMNDAEIPRVIYDVFKKLDIGKFVIRISNRKLIIGLLDACGVNKDDAVEIMRTVDKIEKIGKEEVRNSLISLGLTDSAISAVFKFLAISGSPKEIIEELQKLDVSNDIFNSGVSELSEVVSCINLLGIPEDFYAIDLTIARGLDYYTGTVYETVLSDYPNLGSICSGGRYDNLAEKYTSKKLPGVGISIGLTRLFSQLQEIGIIKTGKNTPTEVLIIPLVEDLTVPLNIATMLREDGVKTEVFFEQEKMKKVLAYASNVGVPFVILIGGDEIASGVFTVKNMISREQVKLSKDQILAYIKKEI